MDVIGREEEQRLLLSFARGAPESPQRVVLVGEAGIGKSTLWAAAVDVARGEGMRVLTARPAHVESGLAHAALGDLLEPVVADVLPELASPRRRALERALLLGDGDTEPVEARTLAVAVCSALQILAEQRRLLVAIDDVQWLDPASTAALAFALRRLDDRDVSVLLAWRPEGAAVPEVVRAVDETGAALRVALEPLSVGAVQQLLRDRLERVLPRPTLLRLHETSGGNPFYALELARALGADVDPTQPLPVPAGLETLLRAGLERLPAETRTALLLACVHDRLAAADVGVEELAPAVDQRVVVLEGGSIRFAHPLLSSALYQSASPEERRQAHGRAATLVGDPIARARHRAHASTGPDADCAAALDDAVGIALSRGAPIAAAELAELALAATAVEDAAARRRRLRQVAQMQAGAGDRARARTVALRLADELPAGVERAEALALLAALEPVPRALELLAEAVEAAGDSPVLQSELLRRSALAGRLVHGLSWAEAHATRSVELAELSADDAARAKALAAVAALRFNGGDVEAPAQAELAYELARGTDDRAALDAARFTVGHVLVWSAELGRARDLFEQQRRETASRDERLEAMALWALALVELWAGRWAEAEAHAAAAAELGELYNILPTSLFPLALIVAHRGDLERAAALAREARERAAEEHAHMPGVIAVEGLALHWGGDPVAAAAVLAEAEHAADAWDWREPSLRWWRPDYVEVLVALGRATEAAELLEAWELVAREVGRGWVLAHCTRSRGLLLAAEGRVGEAVDVLEQAVAQHEAAGDAFGRARALLALGAARRRAQRKRPAREAFTAALAGFAALGAASWVERAREELGHVGGRRTEAGLTPAERRVALLVAEGRTNREVAAALFLGERTVASHLTRVYAKLGVRSRTELARKLQTF